MYKYKNVSASSLTLVAQGKLSSHIVEPGETVTSDVVLENPNLEYVGEAEAPASAGIVGTQVRQPGAVTDAQKVDTAPQEGEL